MRNIYISNNTDTLSVCICDDTGTHYPCSICGKNYDDEIDALICCIEEQNRCGFCR